MTTSVLMWTSQFLVCLCGESAPARRKAIAGYGRQVKFASVLCTSVVV